MPQLSASNLSQDSVSQPCHSLTLTFNKLVSW